MKRRRRFVLDDALASRTCDCPIAVVGLVDPWLILRLLAMKVLELNLPELTVAKLQEAAERLSVSPEDLAILSLEEKLAQLDAEFKDATDYVLNKNAELYKRLA